MTLNFTSDIVPFFDTDIATDANYQAPGNFGLSTTEVGSVGVASATVGTAGSYTTQPTATAPGGATFQVRMKLVTVSAIAAAGTAYTPADVLTLAGGSATDGTHTSQVTVSTVKLVSATIHAGGGGTGYGNAQTFNVTVAGGTHSVVATVNVTTNAGGVVTLVNSISAAGNYTVLPTLSANAATGDDGSDHGSGLSLDLVFGILSVSVTRAGIYTTMPTNPVSVTGGTGTGATLTLAFGVDSLVVLSPGAYQTGVAPTITFSAGAAAATAILASSAGFAGDTQKLFLIVDILRALIAEANGPAQLKDIHEVLRKMMMTLKFGGSTAFSAATFATNAQAAALNYIAKNPTHGGANI
jgi:hypothetical protein